MSDKGGELVAYESQLALFSRDTLKVARIFDCFHDIRMHPRIRLQDILVSAFLMPGCQFTWKSAFSQMWWHDPDAFEVLLTAGI